MVNGQVIADLTWPPRRPRPNRFDAAFKRLARRLIAMQADMHMPV